MPVLNKLRRRNTSGRISTLSLLASVVAAMLMATPAGGSPKVEVQAPFGVWSGPGDHPGDVAIVAIDPGLAGAQHGFFVEKIAVGCGGGPLVLMGPATMEGDTVSLTGDFRCAESGAVVFTGTWTFTYDVGADTMLPQDGDYPAPFPRVCFPGAATIPGTGGDDILTGTAADDIIDGRGGDDLIQGGGGLDILCGGRGRDRIEGGSGIDVVAGGGAKDTILTMGGADGILGWAGNDRIFTGAGRDSAAGGGGKDLIVLGKGDDYGFGGGKKDWLYGNTHDDTLFGNAGPDIVNGGKGNDTCDPSGGDSLALCEMKP